MDTINKNKKTNHIGVMIGNAGVEHPREVITGIFDCVHEENVEITLFLGSQGHALDFWNASGDTTSSTYNYQYNSLYDYALLGEMDALVIAYGTILIFFSDEERESFLSKFDGIPLVILEHNGIKESDIYLMTENYNGMRSVMEHLVKTHGYRKILHLSGPNNSIEANLRKQAYLDVMSENGLEVTDSMIAEGDFTPRVEHQIEMLLDNNSDVDAIVCGNDEMATAAYQVCKKRGIVIGQDLAITGYDDVDIASRLDPPLTTATQDGVTMGYESIKLAKKICEGHQAKSMLIQAPLRVRASCGCDYQLVQSDDELIESFHRIVSEDDAVNLRKTAELTTDILKRNKNVPAYLMNAFISFCENVYRVLTRLHLEDITPEYGDFASQAILNESRRFFNSNYNQFVINFNLPKTLRTIRMLLDHESGDTVDYNKVNVYNKINALVSTYIETVMVLNNEETVTSLLEKSRASAYNMQSLLECSDNRDVFYTRIMEHIKDYNISNAFLYLNDKPLRRVKGQMGKCPDRMYMAVQMVNGNINVMPPKKVRISMSNGFSNYYPVGDEKRQYSAYLLFQEEYQYGLLICEVSYENIDNVTDLPLQLSTVLAYRHLRNKEAASRDKLYKTLTELEEKNKVLSFISANDHLTNLYNRRGFMEQMFSLLHEYNGQNAYLYFFDLDHLKEINDIFGHAEGDYAIISCAEMLKTLFTEQGLIARLGGDEFVGVMIAKESESDLGARTIMRLKEMTDSLNSTSNKPFYVELSSGYTSFAFDDTMDINEILKQADVVLYEAKSHRRQSVRR